MSASAAKAKVRPKRRIEVLVCRACGTEIGVSENHDRLHSDKGVDQVLMDPEDLDYL